jgi:hypothetical protein
MPPIPIMSTETLASCAEARQTGAAQTSAANRTGLTIGHDRCLANAVCRFDSDTGRGAASASAVGMVDRLPMMLSFEVASVGRPIALGPLGVHTGFRSGRLTSSNVATWVLSNQDSTVAPQTLQVA